MAHPKSWADISDFVVHFTKATIKGSDYDNIISICSSQVLLAQSPFGIAKNRAPEAHTQHAVCFTEIPLHLLGRIADRRKTRYGIGFSKKYVRERGALPVWYIEKDSPTHLAVEQLIKHAKDSDDAPADPIWRLTPLVDVPGEYGASVYRFEWEREWRHVGNMSFNEDAVAFLLIPENLHAAARAFFSDARRENLGPAYLCPYIDPYWGKRRIERVLASGQGGS